MHRKSSAGGTCPQHLADHLGSDLISSESIENLLEIIEKEDNHQNFEKCLLEHAYEDVREDIIPEEWLVNDNFDENHDSLELTKKFGSDRYDRNDAVIIVGDSIAHVICHPLFPNSGIPLVSLEEASPSCSSSEGSYRVGPTSSSARARNSTLADTKILDSSDIGIPTGTMYGTTAANGITSKDKNDSPTSSFALGIVSSSPSPLPTPSVASPRNDLVNVSTNLSPRNNWDFDCDSDIIERVVHCDLTSVSKKFCKTKQARYPQCMRVRRSSDILSAAYSCPSIQVCKTVGKHSCSMFRYSGSPMYPYDWAEFAIPSNDKYFEKNCNSKYENNCQKGVRRRERLLSLSDPQFTLSFDEEVDYDSEVVTQDLFDLINRNKYVKERSNLRNHSSKIKNILNNLGCISSHSHQNLLSMSCLKNMASFAPMSRSMSCPHTYLEPMFASHSDLYMNTDSIGVNFSSQSEEISCTPNLRMQDIQEFKSDHYQPNAALFDLYHQKVWPGVVGGIDLFPNVSEVDSKLPGDRTAAKLDAPDNRAEWTTPPGNTHNDCLAKELKEKLLLLHSSSILEQNSPFVEDCGLLRNKTYSYPDDHETNFHENVLNSSSSFPGEDTQARIRSVRSSFYGEDCLTLPPIYEVEMEQSAGVEPVILDSPPKSVEFWSVETLDKVDDSTLERRKIYLNQFIKKEVNDDECSEKHSGGRATFGNVCTASITGTNLTTSGRRHYLTSSNPNPDCNGVYIPDKDSIMCYYPIKGGIDLTYEPHCNYLTSDTENDASSYEKSEYSSQTNTDMKRNTSSSSAAIDNLLNNTCGEQNVKVTRHCVQLPLHICCCFYAALMHTVNSQQT